MMQFKPIESSPLIRNQTNLYKLMDDLINTQWQSASSTNERFVPLIDVREEADAYFIEAEVPGLKREDIDLTIQNDTLFLKGEKKTSSAENKQDYLHIERTHGSFSRAISLANDVDIDRINAQINDGVLVVEIGKQDKQLARRRNIDIA